MQIYGAGMSIFLIDRNEVKTQHVIKHIATFNIIPSFHFFGYGKL